MSSPAKYKAKEICTDEDKDIYDLRDVENKESFPRLLAALQRTISHLAVEFLEVNGVKLDVVFTLAFDESGLEFPAVRFSMQPCVSVQEAAYCQIRLLRYNERALRATAAFNFGLAYMPSLLEVVRAVTGDHPGLPERFRGRDLTAFDFVAVRTPGGEDLFGGCRDWIAQAFIRFHLMGWVRWNVSCIVPPPRRGGKWKVESYKAKNANQELCLRLAGFHEIIGLHFEPREPSPSSDDEAADHEGDGDDREDTAVDEYVVVRYRHEPVVKGDFIEPTMSRVAWVRVGGVVKTIPYQTE